MKQDTKIMELGFFDQAWQRTEAEPRKFVRVSVAQETNVAVASLQNVGLCPSCRPRWTEGQNCVLLDSINSVATVVWQNVISSRHKFCIKKLILINKCFTITYFSPLYESSLACVRRFGLAVASRMCQYCILTYAGECALRLQAVMSPDESTAPLLAHFRSRPHVSSPSSKISTTVFRSLFAATRTLVLLTPFTISRLQSGVYLRPNLVERLAEASLNKNKQTNKTNETAIHFLMKRKLTAEPKFWFVEIQSTAHTTYNSFLGARSLTKTVIVGYSPFYFKRSCKSIFVIG